MLLKDLPREGSLGSSVEVLALMLQSILIRTEERLAAETPPLSLEEAQAIESLVEVLHAALQDAAYLRRRVVN